MTGIPSYQHPDVAPVSHRGVLLDLDTDRDPWSGLSVSEQQARSEALAQIVNAQHYNDTVYGPIFFKVLRLNNAIYSNVYSFSLLFLSIVMGIVLSFALAIATALAEAVNLYAGRPAMKIAKIMAELAVTGSRLFVSVFEPALSLIFPGSYKNLRGFRVDYVKNV